jgi:peptidoglycan/xylan/chitin deacetylase (PgdA/CDA1 family)
MDYAARLSPDRFVIFLFHGVIERQRHKVRNYTKKHLTKDEFAAALRSLLDAGGRPISMDQIAARTEPTDRAFAITFDDGFANNLKVAAPVLDDLKIPATFYVTSDFIDSNRMSWIDRIEWAVEQRAAAELRVPWGTIRFADDAGKRAALDEIRLRIKGHCALSPDDIASDIQSQLDLPETWRSDDALDRKMTWNEVKELSKSFAVGGHTHTHAILSFLDRDALEFEVATPLTMLKERAQIDTCHFSYPEGLLHCYSPEVIDCLKRHGIKICPTAEDGENDRETDLFHLKRVMAM